VESIFLETRKSIYREFKTPEEMSQVPFPVRAFPVA
jgi:hypothetical protein